MVGHLLAANKALPDGNGRRAVPVEVFIVAYGPDDREHGGVKMEVRENVGDALRLAREYPRSDPVWARYVRVPYEDRYFVLTESRVVILKRRLEITIQRLREDAARDRQVARGFASVGNVRSTASAEQAAEAWDLEARILEDVLRALGST